MTAIWRAEGIDTHKVYATGTKADVMRYINDNLGVRRQKGKGGDIHEPLPEPLILINKKRRESQRANTKRAKHFRERTRVYSPKPKQHQVAKYPWTDDELEIIRTHLHSTVTSLKPMLPNRTEIAIKNRLQHLRKEAMTGASDY